MDWVPSWILPAASDIQDLMPGTPRSWAIFMNSCPAPEAATRAQAARSASAACELGSRVGTTRALGAAKKV